MKGVSDIILAKMFEVGRLLKANADATDARILSLLHLETLRFVKEHTEPTMRDVALFLNIAPSSATALIGGLVKDGHVLRRPDKGDRRIVRLAVSAKGERALHETFQRRAESLRGIVGRLSDKEQRDLARILTHLTHS